MDLNTILIILGIIALIGLVGHGVWSNRREKSQYFEKSHTFEQSAEHTKNEFPKEIATPNFSVPQQPKSPQPDMPPSPATHTNAANIENIRITIPNESNEIPQKVDVPEYVKNEPLIYEYHPEPKQPSANLSERTLSELAEFSDTEQGIHTQAEEGKIRISLQNASLSPISQAKPVVPEFSEDANNLSQPSQVSDYIMLYVVAPEKYQFQGTMLAQALEELGFILGRDGLYHRHLDLTIASPVLFSVANVEQPGTFNTKMQDFTTDGVVMFMQLPTAGNPRTNLKMMLRAAKNLAECLDGFVLTDEEQILDEQAEITYLERL